MRLMKDTASLNNWLMGGTNGQPIPEAGMGATILMWTDRVAATIVKVTRTQVHVQKDHAIRIDSNGMSESQDYRYEPNPDAEVIIFRRNKRGAYKSPGHGQLRLGDRDSYHDYSF